MIDGQLKYSPNMDINKDLIQDVMPENVLRVYPYKMINWKKGRAFIQPNTVSIVAVSQLPFSQSAPFTLQKDDGGNLFFEVLGLLTESGVIDPSQATSIFGNEFKYEKQLLGITNDFLGDRDFEPFIVTINKPLDINLYEKDSQAVYFLDSIEPTSNYDFSKIDGIDNSMSAIISLMNGNALTSTLTNSKLKFTKNVYQNKNGDWVSASSSPKYKGANVGIEVPKTSLFNNVRVRGIIDGRNEIINVTSSEEFIPLKSTCISVQEKTTMFMDWFDYSLVMPLFVAENFLQSKTFDVLKTTTTLSLTDKEIDCINDMLLISYLYASQFKDCPRFNSNDIEVTGKFDNDGKQVSSPTAKTGDLRPDTLIGKTGYTPVTIENKDPIKVIDGIYERYLRLSVLPENNGNSKLIKQIICALSRFINSSYSIGRGQNSFNQVYLPWFLVPDQSTPISINQGQVKPENLPNQTNFTIGSFRAVVTLNEIKWKLDSRWFDLIQDQTTNAIEIKTKKNWNLSEVQMIQTDRMLSIPEPTDYIQAINKLPLAGDISTNTSDYLQYFWRIPSTSKDVLNKLFISTINQNIQPAQLDTLTNFTNIIIDSNTILKTDAEKTAFLKKQIAQKYGVSGNNVMIDTFSSANIPDLSTTFVFQDFYYEKFEQDGTETKTRFGLEFFQALRDELNVTRGDWGQPSPATSTRKDITVDELDGAFKRMHSINYDAHSFDLSAEELAKKAIIEMGRGGRDGHGDAPWYFGALGGVGVINSEDQQRIFHPLIQRFTINFKIKGTFNYTDFSSIFNKKVSFDKFSWKRAIVPLLTDAPDEEIICKDDFDTNLDFLETIDLTLLWADNVKIKFDMETINVDLFSQDDDTLLIQRILFA